MAGQAVYSNFGHFSKFVASRQESASKTPLFIYANRLTIPYEAFADNMSGRELSVRAKTLLGGYFNFTLNNKSVVVMYKYF